MHEHCIIFETLAAQLNVALGMSWTSHRCISSPNSSEPRTLLSLSAAFLQTPHLAPVLRFHLVCGDIILDRPVAVAVAAT